MSKFYQLGLCLTCDEVYDRNKLYCPKCLEKKSVPLSRFLPEHLCSFQEMKEARNETGSLPLPLVRKKLSSPNPNFSNAPSCLHPFSLIHSDRETHLSVKTRSAGTDSETLSSTTSVDKSYHSSGVVVEAECGISCRSGGADAGDAGECKDGRSQL